VTSENDVKNAVYVAKEKVGRLNVAVNCAGIGVAFKTYTFNKKTPHALEDFTKVLMVSSYDDTAL
jgi:3-hydroxyacyl-CoA dehydrogenase/3-hydroxy-2-methylbutyryl-CoA dehydrogenase